MFRRKDTQTAAPAAAGKPKDPYVAAREEWNERYGDYISRARNWRLAALFAGLASVILAGGTVYMASQSRYVPYIVEVDKTTGLVANVQYAEKTSTVSQRLMKAMLLRFLTDWRSVSADAVVQKAAVFRVYKMLPQNSAALEKLNAYFRDSSPFAIAQNATVSIEPIAAPLPLSDQSWQLEWWETKRTINGSSLSRIRYKAVVTAAVHEVVDERQALDFDNPLGLFVTDLDWTQQL